MRRVTASLVLCGLAVAACSGDDDGAGTSARTTTSARPATSTSAPVATTTGATTTAPPVTTTAPPCPEPGTDADVVATGGSAAASGLLRDVAVQPADVCSDRVELAFSGPVPGFRVEYQPGPFTESGSGEPVAVDGDAFLVVRLEPAFTFDFEQGAPTYTGPREITPTGTRYVREVVLAGDFEGVVTWVVGLSQRVGLAVTVEDADAEGRLELTLG